MFINFSPNTLGIKNVPLESRPAFARKCGFEGSDLPLGELRDDELAHHVYALAAEAGIRWGTFDSPVYLDASDADFERGLVRLREKAPLLHRAGCTRTYNHVWSGSNTLDYKANFELHRARLVRIAEVCEPQGILFGLEFLGPATLQKQFKFPFIRRVDQMLELIAAVGQPSVGLVLDVFHLYCSGGSVADLAKAPASVPIVNVHLNDARADRSAEAQIDGERAMPMETGVIDSPAVLRWLRSRGYDGPLIAEPFQPWHGKLAAMDAESAARIAVEKLRAAVDASMGR
jgi:sugar phosphate isomerase/epimerase